MSGIAAIIQFDGAPVEPALIRRMTSAMWRRGPDGVAHHVDGPVALGHCMLRTTPESLEETQPLASEDGSIRLVMDGWLFNWEELRTELLGRSARLRTRSDAELVLRAYETWGEDCLAHIDGDVAVVVWDGRKRVAFCARDRMGSKPFHYHWDGKRLIVASDLHAILALPGIEQRPNEGMLSEVLAGDWYSRDETIWRGIMRVVPAHSMSVDRSGPRMTRYWSPPLDRPIRYARDEEYFEHYRAIFTDCVRRTSRSHLPVAYEVSGGLDSSATFCVAEHLRREGRLPAPSIKGYTWLFDEKGDAADEVEYARAVSRHLGVPIAEIPPFKPELSWFDEVYREERNLPHFPNGTMAVSIKRAMVADGCRVMVNGEGGDEWVGGKRHYYAEEMAAGRWREVYACLREDSAAFGPRQAGAWLIRHGVVHFLPRAVKRIGRRFVGPRGPNMYDSAFWLSPAMQRLFEERRARVDMSFYFDVNNVVQRQLLMVLHSSWADQAREMFDRGGARFGLEVRTPYYARPLVEFAFATPGRSRVRGKISKYTHTRSLEGILPPPVSTRRDKAEFSIAFRWQLNKMRDIFQNRLLDDKRGWFSGPGMLQLYETFERADPELNPMWELWTAYACYRILHTDFSVISDQSTAEEGVS